MREGHIGYRLRFALRRNKVSGLKAKEGFDLLRAVHITYTYRRHR